MNARVEAVARDRRRPGRTAARGLRRRRPGISAWVSGALKYLLLAILSASFLLPLYWMASSGLKDDPQAYSMPPVWIPIPAHWNNFWDGWNVYNFNLYTVNTVARYALPYTLGTVLSSAIVAYSFSRLQWPGRDVVFALCMGTMMIPFQVCMVPLFIMFKQMGWINSYRPLVVPAFCGSAFYIFMLRQFFLTIPSELSDSARIDGAGEFRILFRIILPLAKPALTVVALFSFMGAWNDFLGPLIYLNQQRLYTLAQGIASLSHASSNYPGSMVYPRSMAVSTLVTLPIIVTFFLAQRTFIEGISLTGLKG